MSPPPVTRNPAKSTPKQQQQAQRKPQLDTDTTQAQRKPKEKFHFDEDICLDCIHSWFGQQGVEDMNPISETPQKGSDWIAEKKFEILESRRQAELKRHAQELKEAFVDINGGGVLNVLCGLRDLFHLDGDDLTGVPICDPPQKASDWTCQTWKEARRLPFDDGNLDNVDANITPQQEQEVPQQEEQNTVNPSGWHAEKDSMRLPFNGEGDLKLEGHHDLPADDGKATAGTTTGTQQQEFEGYQHPRQAAGLGAIFGSIEGATEGHAICDPPQPVSEWHAEKDSMRLPFNGDGDLKIQGHHDLQGDDFKGTTNADTQHQSRSKQQPNVVTPSDLGKVFGGEEGTTEGHAICNPPQDASAWHAEKDSMRLPFNGDGNQKIEGQDEGDDIDEGDDVKINANENRGKKLQHVEPVTPCDLGDVFGGVEGFTDNHAICDPPQKASDWQAEIDSMRPPFQTQAKHEQNVFMRRQQHGHLG